MRGASKVGGGEILPAVQAQAPLALSPPNHSAHYYIILQLAAEPVDIIRGRPSLALRVTLVVQKNRLRGLKPRLSAFSCIHYLSPWYWNSAARRARIILWPRPAFSQSVVRGGGISTAGFERLL